MRKQEEAVPARLAAAHRPCLAAQAKPPPGPQQLALQLQAVPWLDRPFARLLAHADRHGQPPLLGAQLQSHVQGLLH